MTTVEPRGFMALLTVGGASVALLVLAVSVTSEAFNLRHMVLQYEYEAAATLAADACAQSVVLRIMQSDTSVLIPAYVTLAGGTSCHIDHIDQDGSTYEIYTSAQVGRATTHYRTDVEVIGGNITRVISRKI